MAKTRKNKHDVQVKGKTLSESSMECDTQELKPISVWAQQIKDKLGKSPSESEPSPENITTTLPSPLVAIVQENSVAKMARVLKEKMLAFRTPDTLVTRHVDSSEVTFPSPVPPLEAVLVKPLLEDIAPLPVLTMREKFGHTYQRSFPPPKKRVRDLSEDSEEESTAGISCWLHEEVVEPSSEEEKSISIKTADSTEPALQDTNGKPTDSKKRRKISTNIRKVLPKTSPRGDGKAVKKSKENPKKGTKKTPTKKIEIVVKKEQNKKKQRDKKKTK